VFAAEGADDHRRLAIELVCAIEGAFVLCRALRDPEPLLVAGRAVAASVRATLSAR
jgi:TetR/AcrR family transcriptional repressor of lmrAB and yxaGH operons